MQRQDNVHGMLEGAYIGATESSDMHRNSDMIFRWLRGHGAYFVVEFPFFAQDEHGISGVIIQQLSTAIRVAVGDKIGCVSN
jgi:hypothetical protein